MKLHFPDGNGGTNTIEVSDNFSIYIENLLEDWTLKTASASVKGGIKVGDGLYMSGEYLNVAPIYNPQPDITYNNTILYVDGNGNVSAASLGDGLTFDDGTLKTTPLSYLDTVSTSTPSIGSISGDNNLLQFNPESGKAVPVKLGDGLSLDEGVLHVDPVAPEDIWEAVFDNLGSIGSGSVGSVPSGGNILYTTPQTQASAPLLWATNFM